MAVGTEAVIGASLLIAAAVLQPVEARTLRCAHGGGHVGSQAVPAGSFELFLPGETETAGYRGNVLTLYRLRSDQAALSPERLTSANDFWPDSVILSWADQGEEVTLEVSQVDSTRGTAAFTVENLAGTRARLRIHFHGTCQFAAGERR